MTSSESINSTANWQIFRKAARETSSLKNPPDKTQDAFWKKSKSLHSHDSAPSRWHRLHQMVSHAARHEIRHH